MSRYWVYLIVAILAIPLMFYYDATRAEEFSKPKNKREKPAIPLHKRWWPWTLIVIFVVVAFVGASNDADNNGSSNNKASEQTSQRSKTSSKNATNSSKTNKKSSSSNKNKSFSKSDKTAAALAILKQNYKGLAKVNYDADSDMFMIIPTSTDFKSEMLDLISGEESVDDGWNNLTKSIDSVSRSLYKNVGLKKTSVSLVNPENTSKVLYTSWNGSKVYDFMDTSN